MKRSLRYILTLLTFVTLCGWCAEMPDSTRLDYSESNLWFSGASKPLQEVDVFYILPTCVWNWRDSLNIIHYYADPYNKKQRSLMQGSYELAEEIFARDANFYAPYYRQATLEQWMENDSVLEARFPYAMQDIQNAFDYFVKHFNNERPFIIAGFSQGAKAVVELLKTMPRKIYERMIAAYVIGYRITNDDLSACANIKPAKGASDLGVTICYNSVETPGAICPMVSSGNAVCINPVSWATDETPAMLNDSASVRVDPAHNVLLVTGFDSRLYHVPSLSNLFKPGNYHLQELLFYKSFLQQNVRVRSRIFRGIK